jgi:hypothetical protein
VKEELEYIIKIKIAISLRRLLVQKGIAVDVNSYHDIAVAADLRKATVSDAFNANKASKGITIFLIVKAMGFSIVDFAKIYESVLDSEITQFKKGVHPTQKK